MRHFLLSVLLSFSGFLAYGQMLLEGTVIDSENKETIPYATVYNINQEKGTVTNLDGFFSIEYAEGDRIQFSFLGYERIILDAGSIGESVALSPKAELLGEIVISDDNAWLFKLISNCASSAPKKTSSAKTYYELEAFISGQQVELVEVYYNGTFSGQDVKYLDFKVGRLGMQNYVNQTFMSSESSKAIVMHELYSKNRYFPVSPFELSRKKLRKSYNLILARKFADDSNRLIYEIKYEPKQDLNDHFSGTAWIDSASNILIKTVLEIEKASTHPFERAGTTDSLLGIDFEITKNYSLKDSESRLRSIDFNYDLNFISTSGREIELNTNAVLVAYDYENLFSLPGFEFTDSWYQDYRYITGTPLNEFFWNKVDRFKLSDKGRGNEIFLNLSKVKDQNSGRLWKSKSTFDQVFEYHYIPWSEERLVMRQEEVDYSKYEGVMAVDRYNIEVQLYFDWNETEDEINVLTQTIFDPFKSYYNFPQTDLASCFINIYFDLVEIDRREFQEEVETGNYTKEEVVEMYNYHLEEIKKLKSNYFNEVERGTRIQALRKWNEVVKTELGIDNMDLFQIKD